MYLNEREQTLLGAARDVLKCWASEVTTHAIQELAKAVEIYDAAERYQEQLAALPDPAVATILPDRMYGAHLWILTAGGLYPAHHWKSTPVLLGPKDLHLINRKEPHQFCIDCGNMMFQLEVREQMVSEKKLKKLQK